MPDYIHVEFLFGPGEKEASGNVPVDQTAREFVWVYSFTSRVLHVGFKRLFLMPACEKHPKVLFDALRLNVEIRFMVNKKNRQTKVPTNFKESHMRHKSDVQLACGN